MINFCVSEWSAIRMTTEISVAFRIIVQSISHFIFIYKHFYNTSVLGTILRTTNITILILNTTLWVHYFFLKILFIYF